VHDRLDWGKLIKNADPAWAGKGKVQEEDVEFRLSFQITVLKSVTRLYDNFCFENQLHFTVFTWTRSSSLQFTIRIK